MHDCKTYFGIQRPHVQTRLYGKGSHWCDTRPPNQPLQDIVLVFACKLRKTSPLDIVSTSFWVLLRSTEATKLGHIAIIEGVYFAQATRHIDRGFAEHPTIAYLITLYYELSM